MPNPTQRASMACCAVVAAAFASGASVVPAVPPTEAGSPVVDPAPRRQPPQATNVGELIALALPGLGGLLVLTAGGGVVGYWHANSDRRPRPDAARFLR